MLIRAWKSGSPRQRRDSGLNDTMKRVFWYDSSTSCHAGSRDGQADREQQMYRPRVRATAACWSTAQVDIDMRGRGQSGRAPAARR